MNYTLPTTERLLRAALFLAVFGIPCLTGMTGCVSNSTFKKLDAQIPDGQWDQADVKITGEVVNASLKAKGTKENGKWIEGEIHGTYNGYFVKELTIDLKKAK